MKTHKSFGAGLLVVLLLPTFSLAETLAIVGADIHTLAERGSVRSGTIIIENGRVTAIGANVTVPAGAIRIDGEGKVVTPGVFHVAGQLGVAEVGAEEATVDYLHDTRFGSAAFGLSSAINPRSTLIGVARSEGVTHAMVNPELSLNEMTGEWLGPLAGTGSVIQLASVSDFLVKRDGAVFATLGEDGAYFGGGSRASAVQALDQALADAADFALNREAYEKLARRDYSLPAADLIALEPVLGGKLPLVVQADRASDLRVLVGLATKHKVRLIVLGAAEGWRVAPLLAKNNVGVIVEPQQNLPQSFDSLDAHLSNAARLHEAGVTVAIGESNSHNAGNLKQSAGNAVAAGMPWIAGLAAITSVPAEFYGLGDTLGKIRLNQPANLVIWDGDPLEVSSFAEQVFIDGQRLPMKSRQTLLRDRYLGDKEKRPAYRSAEGR